MSTSSAECRNGHNPGLLRHLAGWLRELCRALKFRLPALHSCDLGRYTLLR